MTERGTSGGMEITSTALLAAAAYFDGRAAHLSNHATGYTRGDIERLHIGLMVDLSQACKHAAQAANAPLERSAVADTLRGVVGSSAGGDK